MRQKIKLLTRQLKNFIADRMTKRPGEIFFVSRLLWPEVCPFCERVYRAGICPECQIELKKLQIKEPRCMKCGKPVRYQEQEYCYDCMHTVHFYDRGFSIWLHKSLVKQSIYQFKYHNRRCYGFYYGEIMADLYKEMIQTMQIKNPDVIIPIPLHKKRRRIRGYNQAEIVADHLGRKIGVSVETKWLFRKNNTNPQKTLNRKARWKNLDQAFEVSDDFCPVRTVLLVDDIYTTGSTIDSVAKVLKAKGVQSVYFLTISIGQGY